MSFPLLSLSLSLSLFSHSFALPKWCIATRAIYQVHKEEEKES